MIKATKNIFGNLIEVRKLQARAQGMGLIEAAIAEKMGSAAIAKTITKAFGIQGVSKEDRKEARATLRKKYDVDPDVEAGFGTGFGIGGGGKSASSKRVLNKIEELKKVIVGMAESITAITKKTDAIGEQNNQILQVLQNRVRQEVGQIMDNGSPSVGAVDLPYGTEKSEGGIITPKETLKEVVREVVVEKPTESEPTPDETPSAESAPETIGERAGRPEPTAVPKATSEKADTIISRGMDLVRKKFPIVDMIMPKASGGGESSAASPTSSTPLSEVKGDVGMLQPSLEGVAKKEPVQSQIEPDELQMLLKNALKDAFEEIKTENPDLFQSEGGGGGGLLSGLAGAALGSRMGKKGAAKGAAKVGAKAVGKTVLKSALKKIPIIGAIAGLGFAASRAMSGDWTGAAMEAGSGLAGTIPGVGTAASVGIDAALAARDAGVIGGGAPPSQDLTLQTAIPTNAGSEIIEMNRSIQTGEVAVRTTPNQPPIVQRVVNNTVLPKTDKKDNIEIGNKESTFNRLLAQDFDHPSTYSNFNMG